MSDQPGSPKPNNTQSIDDKITSESIRRLTYENPNFLYGNRTFLDKAAEWISDHKIPVAVASVVVVVLVSVTAFAIQSSQSDDSKLAADDGPSVTDSDNYDAYSGVSSENGSESNSGVGDLKADGTAPAAPNTFTLTPGSTVINAAWQKVPNATQYVIEIDSDPAMKSSRSITSGINSATIVGLKPMTKYHARVMAINAAGKSPWSFKRSITTRAYSLAESITPLPSAISDIKVSVISGNSVSLTWKSASNATRYTIRRASNTSMITNRKEYAATTTTGYRISDLAPGNSYYFTVQASNIKGYGPTSRPLYAKTRIAVPSITNVSLLSNNTIRTTVKTSFGASSHELRYSSAKSFSGAKTIRAQGTTTLSGLKPATTYYIQVRAKDGSSTTAWSPARSMHTMINTPEGLKANNVSTSAANISWGGVYGSNRYEIRYSLNSNLSKATTKATANSSLGINGLRSGTRYYVQIRAYDGVRWSGWSRTLAFTTPAYTAKLTFATYNVLGYDHNTSRSKYSNPERMRRAAQLLKSNGVDAFVVNEINRAEQRDILLKNLNNWGATSLQSSNQDALVFWNKDVFNLVRAESISIPVLPGKPQRPQPWVELQHKNSGRRFHIFGTHLAQSSHGNNQDIGARALVKKIRDVRGNDKSKITILAGDMNTNERKGGAYNIFRDSGILKNSRYATNNKSGDNCDTHHNLGVQDCRRSRGSHIDHLWISKFPDTRVDSYKVIANSETAHISDHNPLIVTLTVP